MESKQFEENYFNQFYSNYSQQNPEKKMKFYSSLIEKYSPVKNPRVLDVGCAFGKFLASTSHDWKRFGCDLSSFAIEKASRDFPDITFQTASATEIPFDGLFDVITAFDTIEHIPSLEQVAVSIKSKLSERGIFIFVVPVYDGPLGPLIKLLDKDTTHLHKYSRDFWFDWANSNFRVISWLGIYRYLLPNGYYLHQPTSKFRKFAPAIAVVVQNNFESK